MSLGIYSYTLGRGTGEGSGSASDEQCSEWCLVRAGIWLLIELYRVLGACLILFEEGLSYLMCLPPPPSPVTAPRPAVSLLKLLCTHLGTRE